MSALSFKYCPICGELLESGKIKLPADRTVYLTEYVWYYSNSNLESCKGHLMKRLFNSHDKKTAVRQLKPCVPAGYCKQCDRIFAEFEIRDWDNPIGEDEI